MSRLKVLHITSLFPSDENPSLGIFVKNQIDSLRKSVDVELLIVQGLKGIFPYIISIPRIFRILYFRKFDIIHIHYGNISSLVKLLYWGATPIVTSYCGDDLLGTVTQNKLRRLKSLFFRRVNIFLSRRDTFSIVKSKNLETQIKKKVSRIEIIANSVDINKFHEISKKKAAEEIGFDLSIKKKIILFPANIQLPVKNFDLLQKAISNIDNSEFQIITFAGGKIKHDKVPFYFNLSDLVVFTSLSEGSPNVIKEAMACNCKIYSTNCGDVTKLLEGVKGSKILSYDPLQWEKELKNFFANSDTTVSNSRDMLLANKLDLDSVAQRIVDIYYSIVKINQKTYPIFE